MKKNVLKYIQNDIKVKYLISLLIRILGIAPYIIYHFSFI